MTTTRLPGSTLTVSRHTQETIEQIFYNHEGRATALHHTSAHRLLGVTSHIVTLSKLDPEPRCICAVDDADDGHLPLHDTTYQGDPPADLRQLLIAENPPGLLVHNQQDRTPLDYAAFRGRSEEAVDFLTSATDAYSRRDYRALANLCDCSLLTLVRNCLSPPSRAAHDAGATVLLCCDRRDRTYHLARESAVNLGDCRAPSRAEP